MSTVPEGRIYPWVVVGFLILLCALSFVDRQILGLLAREPRDSSWAFDSVWRYSRIDLRRVVGE